MRAPAFWANPPDRPGLLARLLAPLAWIWTRAARRRLARGTPVRLPVPVICVGNVTAGGSGKTPTVIALVERLRARGIGAHVVSRGHGGSLDGPVRVEPARHTAAEVGDEPLLLAAFAPVWIGRDRAAVGRAAVEAGAPAVVMDDGLQNPALAKDLSIVVVDAGFGFGNGRVMPAGPLREPVADGLARADLLLAIGDPEACVRLLADWPEVAALPTASGALTPLRTGMDWQGLRALAFAGIGRPEKFFATLRALGVELVARHRFGDHAPYDARILARLAAEARALNAQLVTTEKDAIRLPAGFRREVLVLPVRLELADWSLARRGAGADRARGLNPSQSRVLYRVRQLRRLKPGQAGLASITGERNGFVHWNVIRTRFGKELKMKRILSAAALVGALVLGATAASATTPAVGSKGETIGQLMASGQISQSAVEQLIMHTGLTMDQAKDDTLDQVIAKRWQNS